jgi:hypothetical protein
MEAAALVAGTFHLALLAFLLVAGVWAYRRFRLPSVPWLLGYLLLGAVLAWPTTQAAKQVVDGAAVSGLGPVGSTMTLGEFLASVSLTSSALAVVGQALVAWFILADLAFAYQRFAPTDPLPAIISVPRQHSYIVGFALLACAAAMPLFWLALLLARQ